MRAVTGLMDALTHEWGRGSGQTWLRHYIARRIIMSDPSFEHLPIEIQRMYKL